MWWDPLFISRSPISQLVILLKKDYIAGVFQWSFNWFISKSSKSASEQKFSTDSDTILVTEKNTEDYMIIICWATYGKDNLSPESLPLKLGYKPNTNWS